MNDYSAIEGRVIIESLDWLLSWILSWCILSIEWLQVCIKAEWLNNDVTRGQSVNHPPRIFHWSLKGWNFWSKAALFHPPTFSHVPMTNRWKVESTVVREQCVGLFGSVGEPEARRGRKISWIREAGACELEGRKVRGDKRKRKYRAVILTNDCVVR